MKDSQPKRPTVQPDVYTVAEVAQRLRCSTAAIYRLCERGEIPHVRIGVLIRIPRHALHDLLENDGRAA